MSGPSYFWSEAADIPPGVGFALFSPAHLAAVALCLCLAALLCRACLHVRSKARFLLGMALAMTAGILARDVFLLAIGRMHAGYLPLHLCGMSVYLCLVHAVMTVWQEKRGAGRFPRLAAALGEIIFILCVPAAFCGVLFAN